MTFSPEHPGPWSFDYNEDTPVILDADGDPVVAVDSIYQPPDPETARKIVEAMNERDRLAADEARYRAHNVVLRDLVRRLLPLAETTVENIRALGAARFPFLEHIKSDRLRGDINREVVNAEHLLREARAAIGEDAR